MARDWQGCPMVNPLCPDDLCILPPRHPKHMHQLTTMVAPGDRSFPMMPHGTPAKELMARGARLRRESNV